MQDIAKRLTDHRRKYKPIIDKAQTFINNGLPIDDQILSDYEDSQMKVAEIYADLISYNKSKSNDRLKKDLYDLFMSLEPKFGCGENPDREKYIAEQLSNAIERYYK